MMRAPVISVYLAASYKRKPAMAALAGILRSAGAVVTSDWHDSDQAGMSPKQRAERDLACVMAARGMMFFAEKPSAGYLTGGRHFELGVASSHSKWLWLIGDPENAFHFLSPMNVYASVSSWAEFIAAPAMEKTEEGGALIMALEEWHASFFPESVGEFVPSDG